MLGEIKDNAGARKSRMRVGRGIGCTKGKTCGRGYKGQTSRTGVRIKGFEGGQMPIHRRLPKRGFNQHKSIEYSIINTGDLQKALDSGKIQPSDNLNLAMLVEKGMVRNSKHGLKLLNKGFLNAKIIIDLAHASKSAIENVEKAGGKITLAA